MIVDCKNRHYTTIKNFSRLLKSFNATQKGAYHFCINCFSDFWTASVKNKHYECWSSNDQVRVKMPSEIERWLKLHDGQYQFRVPFVLYADFESMLKPVDEKYREKMNQKKAERKGKIPYTEKINAHVRPGWCVRNKFVHGDVLDPMKVYCDKHYVDKFIEHIEEGQSGSMQHVHRSLLMCWKERMKPQKNVISILKSFMTLTIER